MMALDNFMADRFDKMHICKSLLSMSNPRETSGLLAHPKPFVFTAANWLSKDQPVDPVKLENMRNLQV